MTQLMCEETHICCAGALQVQQSTEWVCVSVATTAWLDAIPQVELAITGLHPMSQTYRNPCVAVGGPTACGGQACEATAETSWQHKYAPFILN